MSYPQRVLIADDFPVVLEGLGRILAGEKSLKVCASAGTVRSAFELAERHKPDAAILDLQMDQGDGVDFVRGMRSKHPKMRILILSMHEESLYAQRVLRAGADGYIMKARAARELLVALRAVLAGKRYLSPKMSERLDAPAASRRRHSGRPVSLESLSDRELEVFRRVGRGQRTRDIARGLGLSVKTIETYKANIKLKLGLRSAAELGHAAAVWTKPGKPSERS